MKAMILAAGRGERMMPLTHDTPKPLLKVGEYTLIEHTLLNLRRAGISEVVINVCYFAEHIMNRLGDGARYDMSIAYSEEKAGLLGTGGGILQALPLLGDAPFMVVSADIWTDYPFAHLKTVPCPVAHLVLVDNPAFHTTGDFGLQDNVITNTPPKKTYASFAVFNPALFQQHAPGYFSLIDVLKAPIAAGQVTGEYYAGMWKNVGTPALLEEVRAGV